MVLLTSNKDKLKEFKRILPNLKSQSSEDLMEVDGTLEEVIVYKAIHANEYNNIEENIFIVEDTVLIVNGEEVVDIKWKINELKEGDKAEWVTTLASHDLENDSIKIFQGRVSGEITKKRGTKGFAFDPYFVPFESVYKEPNKEGLTLFELESKGEKDSSSARFLALMRLKNNDYLSEHKISEIKPWEGEYQNELLKNISKAEGSSINTSEDLGR